MVLSVNSSVALLCTGVACSLYLHRCLVVNSHENCLAVCESFQRDRKLEMHVIKKDLARVKITQRIWPVVDIKNYIAAGKT